MRAKPLHTMLCCPYTLQVLWDVQTGSAICGSPTHTNFTMCVKFLNNRNDKLMTTGNYNLHVWEYDRPNNKLRPTAAELGQLQRIFKSICIDSRDQFAYCGTTTGDVLQVRALGGCTHTQLHSTLTFIAQQQPGNCPICSS